MCSETATTFTCDVTGGTQAAVVHMVTEYGSSTSKVQAWGEYEGSEFCCESGPNWDGEYVEILGSDYGDTLFFVYDGVNEYLEATPTGWSTALVKGTIEGNGGNDNIRGSMETVAGYSDYLYGGDGADSIKGLDGADYIWGDAGDDSLHGDKAADFIYGGAGADTITGGLGNDSIWGDAGPDLIGGGDGDDSIDGGTQGDIICGDAEASLGDTLNDGDSNAEANPDVLYGANSADTVSCSDSSTQKDTWSTVSSSSPSTCSTTTIGSKPSACP